MTQHEKGVQLRFHPSTENSPATWCRICGDFIRGNCPRCGDKCFPYQDQPALAVCRNGQTPLLWSKQAMKPITMEVCEGCQNQRIRKLSHEDLANAEAEAINIVNAALSTLQAHIAALDGAGNRGNAPRRKKAK